MLTWHQCVTFDDVSVQISCLFLSSCLCSYYWDLRIPLYALCITFHPCDLLSELEIFSPSLWLCFSFFCFLSLFFCWWYGSLNQYLILAKQVLYHLRHSASLVFCVYGSFFQDRVSWTICRGWLQTAILLISAFWVARITGMSYSAWPQYYFLKRLSFSLSLHFCWKSVILLWVGLFWTPFCSFDLFVCLYVIITQSQIILPL
jgi:hypothetical protein